MRKKSKPKFIYAKGRRKTASVRVRLYKGKGENLVNGKPIAEYFPGQVMRVLWEKPFSLTETSGKYHVTARVVGGGKTGQLDAFVHGLARAFSKAELKFKTPIKKAGLLTRDPRVRQRRMVGMGGKSRRKKQSPKR